jgi:hypothetical protein
MAHILNRGIFSMGTVALGRMSQSPNMENSKVQNFPGGGIGARSSAVRRAITARTIPSVVCTPLKVLTALDAASSADFYAVQAYTLLAAADFSTFIHNFIHNTNTYELAAEQATTASSTSSENASNATLTSSAYMFFTETQQHLQEATAALDNAIMLYNQAVAKRDAIAVLSANADSAAARAASLL